MLEASVADDEGAASSVLINDASLEAKAMRIPWTATRGSLILKVPSGGGAARTVCPVRVVWQLWSSPETLIPLNDDRSALNL